MGKKYLDTKKGSLESSILGVWEEAAETKEGAMKRLATGGKEAGLGICPGKLLTVALVKHRLVVEGIDMRGTAGLEKPDHRLRLWGNVGIAGCQGISGICRSSKHALFSK